MIDYDHYIWYASRLNSALMSVNQKAIGEAYSVLVGSIGQPVFIFGNGGSAAIADHFCCDYNKGITHDTAMRGRAISLCSNSPMITAMSNDNGYKNVFGDQLYHHNPKNGLAIAVSSSGNSENIIRGLIEAKELGLTTMALIGFNGGAVLADKLADITIHVDCDNYGIVEDAHMAILHSLIQTIRKSYAHSPDMLRL
jgi:phosphoheptose isomerase